MTPRNIRDAKKEAVLALSDGTVFRGYSIGANGRTEGEVVFNTSMSGYQEILTDPSYVYQILTFTSPHIGNVGTNPFDVESGKVQVAGLIVRELSKQHSNFRSTASLSEWLEKNNVVGIGGIDTRALVFHLRTYGSQMGVLVAGSEASKSDQELIQETKKLRSMDGLDLTPAVTCSEPYSWHEGIWKNFEVGYQKYSNEDVSHWPHVVTFDFGIKYNILRMLTNQKLRVTVVPAQTSADQVKALKPNAIFLSNGPGDPAVVHTAIESTAKLVGNYPLFGICLGHQILGLALGAPTFKLKFGHRGGNHPVKDLRTGKVEITVQNHGFATDAKKIPAGLTISHLNLNDGTVEGFEVPEKQAFSVQYHPESSPGPHDAEYLFRRFRTLIDTGKLD
jgi:carbamoyl-phosphate synthase small subunit